MGDNIRLTFLGDMMFGRYNLEEDISSFSDEFENIKNKKFCSSSMRSIYGNIYDLINDNSDIVCGNLQTCITSSTNRSKKIYNYRMDPKYAKVLKFNSKQVMNLANDHIMDYGIEGLNDTIDTLEKLEIYHVGAGKNYQEASMEEIVFVDDIRIGFLGLTDKNLDWKATKNSGGVFSLEYSDFSNVLQKIKKLNNRCDYLVVSVFWGEAWDFCPTELQKKFATEAQKAGANIICGTSTHFPYGMKISEENNIIMYGLGGFIDDYPVNKFYRNDIGLILNIDLMDIGERKLKVKPPSLIPIKINDKTVNTIKNPIEGVMSLRFLDSLI
jgi:poly-gamma-glutamate synthesis protein (capsule biosynthesis protein)